MPRMPPQLHDQKSHVSRPHGGENDGGSQALSTYSYTKLQSREHFRLLELSPKSFVHPTEWVTMPECKHLHVQLSDHSMTENVVSYDCLSYTWGGDFTDCAVRPNNSSLIKITDNLDCALRCLQHDTQPRLIWIDCICINQDDLEERKQQLQLMYQIYSKAAKVIVFLGKEADGSEHVPGLLHKIERARLQTEKTPTAQTRHWKKEEYVDLGLPHAKNPIWNILNEFVSRPWFTRVWIIQEVLAAAKLEMICGLWLEDGPRIISALCNAHIHGLPVSRAWGDARDRFKDQAARALRQLTFMMHHGPWSLSGYKPWSRLLIDFLEGVGRASASDARDKVYSLLNLCTDKVSLGIEPDYTLDTRTVFQRTARRIIEEGHGLKLLLSTGLPGPNSDLPSWAPDWANENKSFFPIVMPHYMAYEYGIHPSRRKSKNVRLGVQENQIIVTALLIDRIQYLRSSSHSLQDFSAETATGATETLASEGNMYEGDASTSTPLLSAEGTATSKIEPDMGAPTIIGILPYTKDNGQSHQSSLSMYRTYLHAGDLIRGSLRYKEEDHFDVTWKTLICNHTRGLDGKLGDEYLNTVHSYDEINQFMYCPGTREAYLKKVDGEVRTMLQNEIAAADDPDEVVSRGTRVYFDLLMDYGKKFVRDMGCYEYSHRLARTVSGIVGMVPNAAAEDDHVIYIKDMEAPLVVRKANAVDNAYSIVGPAYFHGFMDGDEEDHEMFQARDDWLDLILV